MIEPIPLALAVLLVASSVSALIVRRLLWSLILLFYSSLLLGGILIWYGAVYAGFFHIVTFAGAVSVMFMVIIMLVGQDAPEKPALTKRTLVEVILPVVGFLPFLFFISQLNPLPGKIQELTFVSSSMDDLSFLWDLRPWDLVFVLLPLAAAVLTVINLFSKEGEVE